MVLSFLPRGSVMWSSLHIAMGGEESDHHAGAVEVMGRREPEGKRYVHEEMYCEKS